MFEWDHPVVSLVHNFSAAADADNSCLFCVSVQCQDMPMITKYLVLLELISACSIKHRKSIWKGDRKK